MVVLMRYAFMSFALVVVITTGPAKAGHYGTDIVSGFGRTAHVVSGFSRTNAQDTAHVVSGFSRTNAQDTQVIEISAERFSFNPSEIRVKAGTPLEIRLTSEDTMHGFRILGTDIDLELPKRGRGVASVMFQPTAGRYTFECSRLCGAGHSFMRGVIIATE
jgi:cytochrome c oxidase subunit 2